MLQTLDKLTAVSEGYGKLTKTCYVSGYSRKERRSSQYLYLKWTPFQESPVETYSDNSHNLHNGIK